MVRQWLRSHGSLIFSNIPFDLHSVQVALCNNIQHEEMHKPHICTCFTQQLLSTLKTSFDKGSQCLQQASKDLYQMETDLTASAVSLHNLTQTCTVWFCLIVHYMMYLMFNCPYSEHQMYAWPE